MQTLAQSYLLTPAAAPIVAANELIDSGRELEPRIEVEKLAVCVGCGEEFDDRLYEQCPHCFDEHGQRIEPTRYEMTADGPRAVGGLSQSELRRRVLSKCHEQQPRTLSADRLDEMVQAVNDLLAELLGARLRSVSVSLIVNRRHPDLDQCIVFLHVIWFDESGRQFSVGSSDCVPASLLDAIRREVVGPPFAEIATESTRKFCEMFPS